MSENTGGVYLGIPLGSKYGSKLTLGGSNVGEVVKHLNDLVEIDETDPDGVSAINYMLDGLVTIEAAVNLKMPQASSAPAAANPASNAPRPDGTPSCDVHKQPMTWVADGIVRNGQNTGKHYSAWKCSMPFQPGVKCGFKDFTIK